MRFVARVWKVGRVTLVITVPRDVVEKLGLKPGNLVLVEIRKIEVPAE